MRCSIAPDTAISLIVVIENELSAAKYRIVMPTSRPMSPTRLVRNALRAASEFGFSSHQWPINAKEQTPTNSQPTMSCRVDDDSTMNNIDAVKSDRKA